MYSRSFKEKRDGPAVSEADQELKKKSEARRKDKKQRINAEYAARATKRIEEWMTEAVEHGKAEGEPDTNPFGYEFRHRDKSREITSGPGEHTITARRYVTQSQRIKNAESLPGSMRGEFQEQRFGESPFRKREKGLEKHPPIRFKDVTEAERINASTRGQVGGLGPSADVLKEPIMGYDDIPVGMQPDSVVVRARAKARGPQQFKRFFRGLRMLNPPDEYVTGNEFINANEPTGYGFTKYNNFRPRKREKEIDQKSEFLSVIKGGEVMGTCNSKRADRMEPRTIVKDKRSFYTAAKTLVVMPQPDDADMVVQSGNVAEPETNVDLATRMLKKHGVAKQPFLESSSTCANGANTYAWNELFKFKDHKM